MTECLHIPPSTVQNITEQFKYCSRNIEHKRQGHGAKMETCNLQFLNSQSNLSTADISIGWAGDYFVEHKNTGMHLLIPTTISSVQVSC